MRLSGVTSETKMESMGNIPGTERGKDTEEKPKPEFLQEFAKKVKDSLAYFADSPSKEEEMLRKLKSDPAHKDKSAEDLKKIAVQEVNQEFINHSYDEVVNLKEAVNYQLDIIQISLLKQFQANNLASDKDLAELEKLEDIYEKELNDMKSGRRLTKLNLNMTPINLEQLTKDLGDAKKGLIDLKINGMDQLEKDMEKWYRKLVPLYKFDIKPEIVQDEEVEMLNTKIMILTKDFDEISARLGYIKQKAEYLKDAREANTKITSRGSEEDDDYEEEEEIS